jgi:hypothetical protein
LRFAVSIGSDVSLQPLTFYPLFSSSQSRRATPFPFFFFSLSSSFSFILLLQTSNCQFLSPSLLVAKNV